MGDEPKTIDLAAGDAGLVVTKDDNLVLLLPVGEEMGDMRLLHRAIIGAAALCMNDPEFAADCARFFDSESPVVDLDDPKRLN